MSLITSTKESIVAVGAAAMAGLGAAISGQKAKSAVAGTTSKKVVGKAKAVPKVDVSVPYNAAALLAYNQWKGDLMYEEATFQKFKIIYEEKCVSEVCKKRAIRELDEAGKKADADLSALLTELASKAKFSFQEKK